MKEAEGFRHFYIESEENNKDKISDQEERLYALIEILEDNIKISVISIGIGILIGLGLSIKENTIARYILLFVFGEGAYCSIWTLITLMIYKTNGDTFETFLSLFMPTVKSAWTSFVLIYGVIICGIVLSNRQKVKELNETLKGKKEVQTNKKKLPIVKILIAIISMTILMFTLVIARRSIILIKFNQKIKELNECNNYYVKGETIKVGETTPYFTQERYYKDGIMIYKSDNGNYITYINKNTKELFSYSVKENKIYKNEVDFDFLIEGNPFYNFTSGYFVYEKDVKIWSNIVLAFNVTIKKDSYNGKKCYVIDYNGSKKYVEEKTFLLISEGDVTTTTQIHNEIDQMTNYIYEFGTTTDEDVVRPEIK